MLHDRNRIFYRWRLMNNAQREEVLAYRRQHRRPWHSPPHYDSESGLYLVTAACYEHQPFIGYRIERMGEFAGDLLNACRTAGFEVFAWTVLPNHYHILLRAEDVKHLIGALGRVHGSTSFRWNGEERCRGRKIWFNAMETGIKSERHFWASLLYVLNNAVKHRYVEHWSNWPFSNASEWCEEVGKDEADRLGREFPIDDFGNDWDPPDL